MVRISTLLFVSFFNEALVVVAEDFCWIVINEAVGQLFQQTDDKAESHVSIASHGAR